jgi:hypothetical protein
MYFSLHDDIQSDWPKHVAKCNKSECLEVGVLCFVWTDSLDDWFVPQGVEDDKL